MASTIVMLRPAVNRVPGHDGRPRLLLGYTRLFLDRSLILFSVKLIAVGCAWFPLWLVYLLFVLQYFARIQTG